MPRYGARSLTVSVAQSAAGSILIGGPVRLCGWSLSDGTADQGLTNRGTANAPAAAATIASLSLPNGQYVIEWSVELTGTPGIADVDNVALFIGATQIAQSTNLGAVGDYPQLNANASVSGGPLTLAAKAVGNATAGSVYVVNITVIPLGQSQANIIDGQQILGIASMGEGRADTQWLAEGAVSARTSLAVKALQGTVSGVLWYVLVHDPERSEQQHEY